MPWTVDDVEKHIKGLSDKQKEVWVKVANAARKRCLNSGKSERECDASAIKQANAVAKNVKETIERYIDDPAAARKELWIKVADDMWTQCITNGGSEKECRMLAIRQANAVDRWLREIAEGGGEMPDYEKWLSEQPEEVQQMIEAHIHGLKSALEKERDAREVAERALKILGEVELTEAVWTTKYVNDLPDSCFALILPGGKKDDEGKTVPRSLRKLPYKDASGKVDVPHLRNALARLPQMKDVPVKLKAQALKKLQAVAKKYLKTYQAESEAVDMMGDTVPLVERAVRDDSTIPIKIIQPGWGTSGYYPPEVLARDGPKVFKAGTKMYWDHPTQTEEAERPERSLRDLAAELVTDAEWNENGPAGPGLYAKAKVFKPFRDALDELAPHIGVSIRAMGTVENGEAEGRKGKLVTALTGAKSIDFVTVPGAGGKILELFEAARPETKEKEMEEKIKQLEKENAELREALLSKEAAEIVSEALSKAELPDVTRQRLQESLVVEPPVTADGKLDKAKLESAVQEAVKAEIAYLSEVVGSGAIRGMGSTQQSDGKALKEAFKELYLRQGKTEEEAERLAEIASRGR